MDCREIPRFNQNWHLAVDFSHIDNFRLNNLLLSEKFIVTFQTATRHLLSDYVIFRLQNTFTRGIITLTLRLFPAREGEV